MATTEEEASFSPEHEDPIAGFRQDLDALVINSKPMITMLTMLADDYKELLAGEIVDCIENRLYSVPADQKLPTLYLIDSICKNLGEQSAYVTLFQRKIGGIFTHTFEASNDKTRLLLHKLRSTWTDIFTPEVLHALDLNVHRLDPNWPVVGGGPRNANRSVLPPSTSSTQPPSSAPKNGPTPKATRQPALSLPSVQPGSPTSRELIEAQLQAVRNQQRELQLYNELLLSKMKASTSNSPPEVVSSSTNNSKQQTTTAKDSKQSTVANNSPSTAKRRNASPSSEEHSNVQGKRRRRNTSTSSPDDHKSPNNKSTVQRPNFGKSAEPRRQPQQQNPQNNRGPANRGSRDDREGRSKVAPERNTRPSATSSRARNHAELPIIPPAPEDVIPLGSSHHVSVSQRLSKGDGSQGQRAGPAFRRALNTEGPAIVAAIRSHRRASPPPSRGRSSKSRSPPSERMTFHIPRKEAPPQIDYNRNHNIKREEGDRRGDPLGFAMDVDYRQAFVPPVKVESISPPLEGQQNHFVSPVFQPPLAQPQHVPPPALPALSSQQTQILASQLSGPNFQVPQPLQLPPSTTTSTTPSKLVEPHGSVVLYINGELARLYYLDNVTAVVVKAHPDTPFDALLAWAPETLEPRQVFFAGPTTHVYVDEETLQAQTLCLDFGARPVPLFLGPSQGQHTIGLGLPARELVVDGAAYTIAFGGEAISVLLEDPATPTYHTFRLSDSRPHLQFSDVIRTDLWSRLVDDARVKGGLPPLSVAFPSMPLSTSTLTTTTSNSFEVPPKQEVVEPQTLQSPDLNSLLSKLTAAGLISNPPATLAPSAAPDVKVPLQATTSSTSILAPTPLAPPVISAPSQFIPPRQNLLIAPLALPSTHHPNGAKKSKRERRNERQRHRLLLHQQAQSVAASQTAAREAARAARPLPPKKYLSLDDVKALKQAHPFAVDQLYSGTPCTNCSLRFGEEDLRAEEGKKSRYARHLDWHFRQNRRLKAKPASTPSSSAVKGKKLGAKEASAASSSSASLVTAQRRAWYYPLELWILYKEVNDDLEEEAAAAAAFFDSAVAAGSSTSSSTSTAALQLLASFDWSRFKETITPFEAFMEVVNLGHADQASEDKKSLALKGCTVVAESSFTEITCALCQEVLEQKWGEEEEEWRVENAVRFAEVPEEGEEDKEKTSTESRIHHPLCLKDYLLQKEKQKKLSQQETEEEEVEDENEDEDADEDEEETSTMNITDNQENNEQMEAEEEKVAENFNSNARVLIPGLDISLRSSTDEDEVVRVQVKEEEVEEMDVPAEPQVQAEKEVTIKEEEEMQTEIQVKVIEFEIPIAPLISQPSTSESLSTEQLEIKEESTATAISSEESSISTSLEDQQALPNLDDEAISSNPLEHSPTTSSGKSQPAKPRSGLVIKFKKTSVVEETTSTCADSDDQQLPSKNEEKDEQFLLFTSSTTTDQSTEDNKVYDGGHVKEENDDDANYHVDSKDDANLMVTEDLGGDEEKLPRVRSQSESSNVDGGVVSSSSSCLSPSEPLKSPPEQPEVQVEASESSDHSEELKSTSETDSVNYYSRGKEESSLCSIM